MNYILKFVNLYELCVGLYRTLYQQNFANRGTCVATGNLCREEPHGPTKSLSTESLCSESNFCVDRNFGSTETVCVTETMYRNFVSIETFCVYWNFVC